MSETPAPLDIEQITRLAKQFVDRNLFDEAAEFFQIASRLDPDNLGIKLSLAQVRNQQRQKRRSLERDLGATLLEQVRRNAIDAFQFFGLAALYEERGKREQAAQCLEIARSKGAVNPFVHKLHGKVLLAEHQFDAAADELRRARRYNPFDRELSELLSRAEYECERYDRALAAAIDAFWLLHEDDRERADQLKRRIRTLKTVMRLPHEDLVTLFHQQREQLQTAFDRLEWQREQLLRDDDLGSDPIAESPPAPAAEQPHLGRIVLADRLRRLRVFDSLDDIEIFQLTEAVHGEELAPGEVLFRQHTEGTDIYVIEQGQLTIQRATHYGTVVLGSVAAGALLGEVNFLSRYQRSADAVAGEPCRLLRLDTQQLERLIESLPDFGIKIYQCFWLGLSHKLRRANEQLRTFFADDGRPRTAAGDSRHDRIEMTSRDKIRLFREQGLSGAELTTLATFSEVKRFPAGSYLFHEGDAGEEMYVVLDGKVMISKFIPGGGEEALAILERGDFFGEMSLIDGQPRSADAKVHGGAVTVVAFDETTLNEVLSMDPSAALQFMMLLCRLICKRLREIDEKITSWRIMAGTRDEDLDATLPAQQSLGA